jgi:hypothetical protein
MSLKCVGPRRDGSARDLKSFGRPDRETSESAESNSADYPLLIVTSLILLLLVLLVLLHVVLDVLLHAPSQIR